MSALEFVVIFGIVMVLAWGYLRPSSTRKTSKAPATGASGRPAADRKGDTPPHIPAMRHAHHAVLKGRAYVIDGDTIVVQKRKIRLAGIDAPEIDMPWGRKSKWAMVHICKGQSLTVHLTGEVSYDRLVGTAYLPDGRDIGAEIVKTGLALDLPHFSGGKYRAFEPEGARARLRNGFYGHSSLRWKNRG